MRYIHVKIADTHVYLTGPENLTVTYFSASVLHRHENYSHARSSYKHVRLTYRHVKLRHVFLSWHVLDPPKNYNQLLWS